MNKNSFLLVVVFSFLTLNLHSIASSCLIHEPDIYEQDETESFVSDVLRQRLEVAKSKVNVITRLIAIHHIEEILTKVSPEAPISADLFSETNKTLFCLLADSQSVVAIAAMDALSKNKDTVSQLLATPWYAGPNCRSLIVKFDDQSVVIEDRLVLLGLLRIVRAHFVVLLADQVTEAEKVELDKIDQSLRVVANPTNGFGELLRLTAEIYLDEISTLIATGSAAATTTTSSAATNNTSAATSSQSFFATEKSTVISRNAFATQQAGITAGPIGFRRTASAKSTTKRENRKNDDRFTIDYGKIDWKTSWLPPTVIE